MLIPKKKRLFLLLSSFVVFLPAAVSATGWVAGQANVASSKLPGATASIYGIIGNTLSWLLAVLGFIAVMGFVISGIQYLLSAGDDGMIERAKTNMKYSIVGVIVALMGFVVIKAINSWLNASDKF